MNTRRSPLFVLVAALSAAPFACASPDTAGEGDGATQEAAGALTSPSPATLTCAPSRVGFDGDCRPWSWFYDKVRNTGREMFGVYGAPTPVGTDIMVVEAIGDATRYRITSTVLTSDSPVSPTSTVPNINGYRVRSLVSIAFAEDSAGHPSLSMSMKTAQVVFTGAGPTTILQETDWQRTTYLSTGTYETCTPAGCSTATASVAAGTSLCDWVTAAATMNYTLLCKGNIIGAQLATIWLPSGAAMNVLKTTLLAGSWAGNFGVMCDSIGAYIGGAYRAVCEEIVDSNGSSSPDPVGGGTTGGGTTGSGGSSGGTTSGGTTSGSGSGDGCDNGLTNGAACVGGSDIYQGGDGRCYIDNWSGQVVDCECEQTSAVETAPVDCPDTTPEVWAP